MDAPRPPADPAAAGGDSLDIRTQLDRRPRWHLKACPDAGEATLVWLHPTDPETRSLSVSTVVPEDERAKANWERANRRARVESRRYMVSNRLRFMWVLTFANDGLHGADGRAQCLDLVAAFVRRLRKRCGPMPYWYSPELHPGGHGWHVNFFVPKFIRHEVMMKLWGHGIVNVSDWARHSKVLDRGLSRMEAVRLGASYGCKYASKDWSTELLHKGARRYNAAEGFEPRQVVVISDTFGDAYRAACRIFGALPSYQWRSDDLPAWEGPPVWCLFWSELPEARKPLEQPS